MTVATRSLLAVGLMSVGLLLLVVDSVDKGWTALAGIGVGCLAVAIAAQLVVLRQSPRS